MKKRLLITSIVMMLVVAVALSTATYAWFSTNSQVTATGMTVTAKSNATFLLINDSNTAGEGANTKTASYGSTANTTKTTYPVAYYATASTLNGHATTAGKWYKTTSNSMSTAVSGTDAITEVTEGSKDYMLTYKVWLTLSPDSEAITNKSIKVTFSKGESDDAALSAVVIVGTSSNKFAMNSTNNEATTAAAVSLTGSSTVEVTVYVYMDGNSTNVNSTYAASHTITGTVGLQFDLVAVPSGS